MHSYPKLICILTILFLLASCHPTPQSNAIRMAVAIAPSTLDPRFATDATSMRINRLLYRSLVDFDAEFNPIPNLAHWTLLSPTHYRFHLHENTPPFHNGEPLTAEDVKATYTSLLDPQIASPHRSNFTNIQQINLINSHTLDFILTKPDTLFPGRLTLGILPKSLLHTSHPFQKQPVGNGNFRYLHWPHSAHLILERLQDQQPIEFLEIKDPVVRVLKLLRQEVDILQNDLSPELIHWLNQRPHIQVTFGKGSHFTYLGFNLNDPNTGQLAIRQAIAHALNRSELIEYILGKAATLANSFMFLPNHWAGDNTNFLHYDYDPIKAQKLLASQGFTPENPLPLVYKTSNNPFRIRLASVIQQQLAKVGIRLELRSYDWGTFYGDIKDGRFQLFSLSWVGIKMPDIFRYAFHSTSIPPSGANRGRLKLPLLDTLIERTEQALTLQEQTHYYQNLQQLLWQELPYVPLWFEDQVLVTNQRIKGYTLALDGNYDALTHTRLTASPTLTSLLDP